MIDVPKIRMPFTVTADGIGLIEQDTIDEIGQCVYAVLATPLGSRAVDPEFGLNDQAHVKNGARLEDLTDAIEASEPRVTELDFEDEWDGVKQRVRTVIG